MMKTQLEKKLLLRPYIGGKASSLRKKIGVVVVLLIGLLSGLIPQQVKGQCKRVFDFTGSDQTFTVPAGVTSITMKVWGAGGGGINHGYYDYTGGAGAGGYTTAKMTVTPGQILTIKVGQGGVISSTAPTYGGGGGGGAKLASFGNGANGSSGGGYSGIFIGSTPVIIAGGGGGASQGADQGGVTQYPASGGGGGLIGGGGTPYVGGGGTQSAGGAGAGPGDGPGMAGSAYTGGRGGNAVQQFSPFNPGSNEGGGGGGGGYYGGGGGASQGSNYNGGGGGGSSYIGYPGLISPDTIAGENGYGTSDLALPGNSADADRASAGNVNQSGRVVISYQNATLNGINELCIGSTHQFSVAGTTGITPSWTSSSPAIASVSGTGLVTGLTSGTAIITYTDSVVCPISYTITIKDCSPANTTVDGECKAIFSTYGASTFTVPAGVTSITMKVWGAGGGGINHGYYDYTGGGGAGGYTTAKMTVTPGQVLSVRVGQQGAVSSTAPTYGGGGGGGAKLSSFGNGANGSSGGGYSGIFIGSTPVIIAGGGGGASQGADSSPYPGAGGGGGLVGGGGAAYVGGGGTQSAGGAGAGPGDGPGMAGSAYTGGRGGNAVQQFSPFNPGSNEGGGGGGGGYYGGGGGASQGSNYNGGGGGGSSYIGYPGLISPSTIAGENGYGASDGARPGNYSDLDRGTTAGNVNQPGRVVISYSNFKSITGSSAICKGANTQLTVSGVPASGITWTSSNPAVATVSSTGLVQGVSVGNAVITYMDNVVCKIDFPVTITDCAVPKICLTSKTLLQGALFNLTEETYNSALIMRDDLRVNNLIPSTQPYNTAPFNYAGTETIATPATVLADLGNNSIVDWVLVELRSAVDPTVIIATRAGLLQRDGDIVEVDGTSCLKFNIDANAPYYVAVRHRNHLGAMTATPVLFNTASTTADLTTLPLYKILGAKEKPSFTVGGANVLWAGDLNRDGLILLSGNSNGRENDIKVLYDAVINHPGNTFGAVSYSFKAYDNADSNMNGYVKYSGASNDQIILRKNVLENSDGNIFHALTYPQFLTNLP
ncbi:Ig-like domain-containing protein [Chryseobacterium sp. GMJ5]|uniref:receptor protein-tyrosine kinase n=1 Tax=Chryseobacterium gilvum TaxID=2976534 RepID=A0ABT2VXB1_9FLAO|nr:Ig-like domain-containing protein [Chryseobacterium gilvum]MCU7614279.1 Ig-like domain-containing protein [Chryseobacterium gilvum]